MFLDAQRAIICKYTRNLFYQSHACIGSGKVLPRMGLALIPTLLANLLRGN